MIRLDSVTKTFGNGVVALSDLDLEIGEGEFAFIVGASGAGKTTLIKLLIKDEEPDSSEIWVGGRRLARLRSWKVPALRRDVGCVFQDFKLLERKTVAENVAFALEVIGRPRRQITQVVPEVLRLVGLGHKRDVYPRELSSGEQQRVSIARALVNRPGLVLCDEPTGNLDPTTSVGIMRLLDRINRSGTTVVMATHNHHIVDSMRRRVVELDDGRMVRDQARGVYGYGG